MSATPLSVVALGCAIALLAACDGQGDEGGPLGVGGGGATSAGGSTGSGGDEAGECAAALELQPRINTLGGPYYEHRGALDPSGDRDSFRFTVEAGQWFAMTTQANPERDPSKIDTVLTLRDDAGSAELAQSDDASPPGRPDSEIIHRFSEGGSYCLEVSEHADRVGSAPRGGPSFRYRLLVYPVDFELYDDWNLDTEPNDQLDTPQALSVVPYQGYPFTRIVGQLGAGDVDVARFVPSATSEALAVVFTPSGSAGNGASLGPGLVRLRHDDAEAAIIAELDYQSRPAEGYLLEAPGALPFGIVTTVTPGQATLLEVVPPAGANPGADDFYAFTIETAVKASVEAEPNDDWTTETYTGQVGDAPGVTIHEIVGQLPPGDVDWWTVSSDGPGTTIELSCASWQLGSSLRDATFTLFPPPPNFPEPPDEPVQAQTETQHTTVRWSDDPTKLPTMPAVVAQDHGVLTSHSLRVTATQYEPSIESVYYACKITSRAP